MRMNIWPMKKDMIIRRQPAVFFVWMWLFIWGSIPLSAQQPSSLPVYSSSTPVNLVRTWEARAPITNVNTLTSSGLPQVIQSTQYVDGLGRPFQMVRKQGAFLTTDVNNINTDVAAAKDLVSAVLYNENGIETHRFLPFSANTAGGNSSVNDGAFKQNPYAQQQQFMNNKFAAQAEANFYSQTVFEKNPLKRPSEQFAPGTNWAGTATQSLEANRKSIKTRYGTNTSADYVMRCRTTDAATPGSWGNYYRDSWEPHYRIASLSKLTTIDEHSKQVVTFIDSRGRIILKKVQLDDNAPANTHALSHTGWLCTYYIYDDRNLLRCVIQPEGVKALLQNNWNFTSAILDEQCFRYEYDEFKRMILKKVPGAAEVYMVYDALDRLVMTQDGNLRAQGMWTYTRYDGLNRAIATGVISDAGSPATHRSAAANSTNYPSLPSGTQHLTETFYDNYEWIPAGLPSGFNANYDNTLDGYLLPASNTTHPYAQQPAKESPGTGRVTGTRVKKLNTTDYIYTLSLYDDKGRLVQEKSINHTGGVDITTTQHSWSGQPLVVAALQNKISGGTATITTVTKNAYDALDRLVQTTKNIIDNISSNSSGDKVIAQYFYDELGQLITKKLGVSSGTPLETQNYDYNIRGWLLGMNRDYVNGTNNTKYFGFDLAYDKTANLSGMTSYSKAMYNGNISGMTWRGSTGSKEIRRYDYDYDNANRLLKGDFKDFTNSAYNGAYDIKMGDGATATTAYDDNGNILKMWQKGLVSGSSQIIDDLTYTYQSGSNKLAKVTDAAALTTGLGDFNNGSNIDDDYAYDMNGSLTLDKNKDINSISYNVLNLPEQITVTAKGTISYQYDAAGNKLSKTVTASSGTTTTVYLGGTIFENNILQHIATDEGRARLEAGTWKFDYFLKDHLGNVRMMLADNGTVLEETHYYPFGLTQKGISTRQTGNLHNKENTFQNQQIDEDLDLNWVQFKYRNHDPQIGRFIEVDPLSEDYVHNSTYAFSENKVVAHIELEGLESIPFPLPVPFPFLPPAPMPDPTNGRLDEVAKDITYIVMEEFVVSPVSHRPGIGFQRMFLQLYNFLDRVFSSSDKEGTTSSDAGQANEKKDNTLNRVKPRKGTVDKVTENQQRTEDGKMIDPNTGEPLGKEVDLGHKPGNEWWRRKKMHKEKGSTRKDVIEAENDPNLYQWENRSSNRSHKYEKKGN
ncbi:DUF6443 domain-containing protein [Niabella sp. 22666]|uniref:DUF6443 domain-containing protein n=1 Tax=Niabella sp. 22666 TaxID=3453954 RepID=UPI003F84AE45